MELMSYTNSKLAEFTENISLKVQRNFVAEILKYIEIDTTKVFALAGLRRTGKTYGMLQTIKILSEKFGYDKITYIECSKKDLMLDLFAEMERLRKSGVKYFFIDEISSIDSYYDDCARLSNHFCRFGKVIIAGTQSAAIAMSSYTNLFDRIILCNTTQMLYPEFVSITGKTQIADYLEYGRLLLLGESGYGRELGVPYYNYINSGITLRKYIGAAIISNIVDVIFVSKDPILETLLALGLDVKQAVTAMVLSIVVSINHTASDVPASLNIPDVGVYSNDMIDAKNVYEHLLEYFGISKNCLMDMPDKVRYNFATTVVEYMCNLGLVNSRKYLIASIEEDTIKSSQESKINILYPLTLRYCFTKLILDIQGSLGLDTDKVFTDNTIRGYIFEDMLSYHIGLRVGVKAVLKIKFKDRNRAIGEFNIVAINCDSTVSLYEVKYDTKAIPAYARHLEDDSKIRFIESTFGEVKERVVLYNGKNEVKDSGVIYKNASEFLTEMQYDENYHYTCFDNIAIDAQREFLNAQSELFSNNFGSTDVFN